MKTKKAPSTKLGRMLRQPSFIIILIMTGLLIFAAIFGPYLLPHDYATQNLANQFASPSAEYPFGTDQYGRCIFCRIIYGSRIALKVGLIAVGIEAVIGVTLGLISGWYGGPIDKVVQFVTDVTWAIPPIILSMAIIMLLEPSSENIAISIALVSWGQLEKIVRSKTMALKNLSYIDAARIYGESSASILFRYILPNLMSTIVIMLTLALPGAMLSTTMMSFLGLGSQPPSPDWGMIVSEGVKYLRQSPWISIATGLAILWAVLSFNLFGEKIKDLIDPKMRV
ncbi:MAG: ABC transporter permease [Firmicutes bacterium]|nr:ABC transporter permease [Bacillota bacterium]MCR4711184.1 ABC transporter permease [Clostridia bacterium]